MGKLGYVQSFALESSRIVVFFWLCGSVHSSHADSTSTLIKNLSLEEITAVVTEIEKEKEAEAEKKKSRTAATAASREAMISGQGVVVPPSEPVV